MGNKKPLQSFSTVDQHHEAKQVQTKQVQPVSDKSHKLDWIHKQYFANKSVTEKKVKFLFEGFSHKPNTTSKVSMVLWLCVRSQSCQSGFN